MNYGIKLVTAPEKLPVTVAEAKAYARVEESSTEEDALFSSLIQAAVTLAESYLNRYLITQTHDLTLDCFPSSDIGVIYLPKSPVQSITSITYVDDNGATQTWGASNYLLDGKQEPARLTTAYNISYPSIREQLNSVTIRHVVGYGTEPSNVPETIRTAIKLLVNEMFNSRQQMVYGVSVAEVSVTAERLLSIHRLQRFD